MNSTIDNISYVKIGPSRRTRHHSYRAARPLFRVAAQIRKGLMRFRVWYLRRVMKMDIHPKMILSLKANLDFTNPRALDNFYSGRRAVLKSAM
jgi:hypothetical protein